MKNLNIIMYIANMTKEVNKVTSGIEQLNDLDEAKRRANRVMGYIESLTVMVNTMICTENNDITAQIEDLTDEMTADLYQALVYVADRVGDKDKFCVYCDKRDEYRGSKWRG